MILMIGATGLVGGETARLMSGRDVRLRALVRNPGKAGALREGGFEVVQGDADDADSLAAAMRRVETVFLSTAAEPGLPETHRTVVSAAQAAGVKRIVKVSATGAHPKAKLRFAAVHGMSDSYIRESGLAWTILKPSFFMQNLIGSAAAVVNQHVLPMPLGDARAAYIDARDIAAVSAKVLLEPGHDGKAYDLTGPAAVSGAEMAAALSAALGTAVQYVSPDIESYAQTLLGYGVPEWIVGGLREGFALMAAGSASHVSNATEQITGRPAMSIEQFARDYAPAFAAARAQAG